MTERTDAAEVEALADQLVRWEQGHDGANETDHWADRLARAILASDWLAAREAAAEVRGAQAVLAAVEPIHTAWEPTGFRYTDGRQIPVCTVDEEVFPCSTLRAARAAAAAAGGGGEA